MNIQNYIFSSNLYLTLNFMFIKTHSVRQDGGQSMNGYGSSKSNI